MVLIFLSGNHEQITGSIWLNKGRYDRDAKTYKRANKVCVIFFILGKVFANFCAVLSRNWVMLRFRPFWWHFLATFGTLCYFWHFPPTICVFWAFYAVLSRVWFVVIHTLFQVKYFWLKQYLCKKKVVFLYVCDMTLTMCYSDI